MTIFPLVEISSKDIIDVKPIIDTLLEPKVEVLQMVNVTPTLNVLVEPQVKISSKIIIDIAQPLVSLSPEIDLLQIVNVSPLLNILNSKIEVSKKRSGYTGSTESSQQKKVKKVEKDVRKNVKESPSKESSIMKLTNEKKVESKLKRDDRMSNRRKERSKEPIDIVPVLNELVPLVEIEKLESSDDVQHLQLQFFMVKKKFMEERDQLIERLNRNINTLKLREDKKNLQKINNLNKQILEAREDARINWKSFKGKFGHVKNLTSLVSPDILKDIN